MEFGLPPDVDPGHHAQAPPSNMLASGPGPDIQDQVNPINYVSPAFVESCQTMDYDLKFFFGNKSPGPEVRAYLAAGEALPGPLSGWAGGGGGPGESTGGEYSQLSQWAELAGGSHQPGSVECDSPTAPQGSSTDQSRTLRNYDRSLSIATMHSQTQALGRQMYSSNPFMAPGRDSLGFSTPAGQSSAHTQPSRTPLNEYYRHDHQQGLSPNPSRVNQGGGKVSFSHR
ncbi:hypothetical protein NMY22_g2569 [Coprinellus aureogranulatus]|nr:hypothetical protein NMY22_g2569 [Coprinellus aureogranulatus]